MKSPCYECQDRKVGCHGICETYLAWKEADKERREKISKAMAAERDVAFFRYAGVKKAVKARHTRNRRKK